MFQKILIANRGEIACRILRTARRMGIKTVAVYSEADATALHVALADEAVAIGPPPAAESYLLGDKIIEACRASGAEAVHPGFGFLAENAEFVRALDAVGLIFIGPPQAAISAMGDKIESKRIADDAGVVTVPGYLGVIADADEAVRVAHDIGYPVMIKASAGGGGKGMRVVADDKETREGFRSAQNEARSSFGDDRVFIEKYIEEPRHIEIQVLADQHGRLLHLGERECSIQRRHQKVIEEAPSPLLDPAMRALMGEQAVALARAVDYHSAGTVEFIVDKDKRFYFLEMNTRIQVEHPVTEMITGLDLVEWMIRIAAGEKIDFTQDQVRLEGWAVEARIYAEDPRRDFLPSVGRLVRYREPPMAEPGATRQRRVDSGVVEGSEIPLFYDPMIAKLVTHAPTRQEAIEDMESALDGFYIRGIDHNIAFLAAVMGNARFRQGQLTTNFIAEEFPEGFSGLAPNGATLERLLAVAAIVQWRQAERELATSGRMDGGLSDPGDRWVVIVDGKPHQRRVEQTGRGFRIIDEETGSSLAIECDWTPSEPLFRASLDGVDFTLQVERQGAGWRLVHGGAEVEALVLRPKVAALAARMPKKPAPDLSRYLLSPMPGLLVSLDAEVGQDVKAGETLAVIEAMKMENVLLATRDGIVAQIHATPGESLAVDQAILEFE